MGYPVQQQEDDDSATLPVMMLKPDSGNIQVGRSMTLASKSLRLYILHTYSM